MYAGINCVNSKCLQDWAEFGSKYSPHYLKCKVCYGSCSLLVVVVVILRESNILKDMGFQFAQSFVVLFSFPDDPCLSVRKGLQKIKV